MIAINISNVVEGVLIAILAAISLGFLKVAYFWFQKPRSFGQVWKYCLAKYKTRHNPDEVVEWKNHFGGNFRQKTKPKPKIVFLD